MNRSGALRPWAGAAWSLLATLVCIAQAHAASPAVLSFEDVRPGMKGIGRTVFEGTRIETFQVEILGKLPNVGPDQNLILARLSGGPLAKTGVLAGMSGSPVFVDGKLIGAVAYTWGFSTEPVAGITPIEEMLAVASLEPVGPAVRSARGARLSTGPLEPMRSAPSLRAFFDEELRTLLRPVAGLPVAIPLAVSGIEPAAPGRVLPELARAGFLPLPAGDIDQAALTAGRLEPGAAMGLKLVRGDLDMTATGTVTWVDDDRVLAFGHALFGLGPVDLPLTGATVQALLPNLNQSARIATPTAEIGALRQDRAAGVFGLLDADPRMIPVRLVLKGATAPERAFSFDIADDPLLSPILLYTSLNAILASKERAFGSATVRLEPGSMIMMVGSEDIALDNVFAGSAAFDFGTGIAAYVLHLLMNNTWTQPQIAGVHLLLEYEDVPRTARIRRVTLDRYRVVAGDTTRVTVVLSPYRGPDRVLTREVVVPPETPPGKLELVVGGALAVSRVLEHGEPVLPKDLDQLIWLINQLRRNDRVYILARHEDSGVLLGGARLPNLPPSVARVLSRPRSLGNYAHIPHRSILEEVIKTDYAVDGSARIQLEVEPR